ncbi:MAG TPA: hypothetical protein VEN81_13210 [Planctomycetota bacterium]|nr:hypothetical protein [Planctomycetota bacterium]
MNVSFGPDMARVLAEKAKHVHMAGRELALFGENEPWLASDAGIEIGSLEARTILSSGATARVFEAADSAARSGKTVSLMAGDVEALSRLEGVLASASAKIAQKQAMLEAQESPMAKVGQVLGLAATAIGVIKQVF